VLVSWIYSCSDGVAPWQAGLESEGPQAVEYRSVTPTWRSPDLDICVDYRRGERTLPVVRLGQAATFSGHCP
jgi:hypothetical protein